MIRRQYAGKAIRDGFNIYAAVHHPDPGTRRLARAWVRSVRLTAAGLEYYREMIKRRRVR